jgi:signal transduction histidine kinase
MELFLPGIAALLIAALLVFLVLPRFGAPALAVLSIILLVYGVWSHMTLFYSEYRYSTFQERIKSYASFVLLGLLILGLLMYMMYLFGTQGPSALPASNLTPAQTVAVNNAMTSVANSIGIGNGKKNNGIFGSPKSNGVVGNLGAILNTPMSKKGNRSGSLL